MTNGSDEKEHGATRMQQEHSINTTSAKTRQESTSVPVETVVCVETKSLESANETNGIIITSPQEQQEEEDVFLFQSDDSRSQTKSPLPQQQDLEFDNGGLSDGDLMKLFDSPDIACANSKKNDDYYYNANKSPATKRASFPSPADSTVSIDTANLEIPHACTPRETTSSSRFFGAAEHNNNRTRVLLLRQYHNPTRLVSTTTQSQQDVINLVDEHDATLETNQEQARQESTTLTAHHPSHYDHDPVIVQDASNMHRAAQVDPSVYQPLVYQYDKPDPMVHHLSMHNRPKHARSNIAVQDLFGPPYHRLWKFSNFNPLQSEMAHTLAHSDDSIVVSAPTGAGKTCLFEMSMARFFANNTHHKTTTRSSMWLRVKHSWKNDFGIGKNDLHVLEMLQQFSVA